MHHRPQQWKRWNRHHRGDGSPVSPGGVWPPATRQQASRQSIRGCGSHHTFYALCPPAKASSYGDRWCSARPSVHLRHVLRKTPRPANGLQAVGGRGDVQIRDIFPLRTVARRRIDTVRGCASSASPAKPEGEADTDCECAKSGGRLPEGRTACVSPYTSCATRKSKVAECRCRQCVPDCCPTTTASFSETGHQDGRWVG